MYYFRSDWALNPAPDMAEVRVSPNMPSVTHLKNIHILFMECSNTIAQKYGQYDEID